MNAPRPPLPKTPPGTPAVIGGASNTGWWLSPRGRAVLSVIILLHFLAVIGEPMRMFSQGRQAGSPDALLVRGGMAPYIDFAYLHHGYFFFAPNPGPSHLIDIKLTDADQTVRHLRLPNHRAQWPRLLYHRHFMLSEFLFQLYTPAPNQLGPDVPVSEELLRDRALFERVRGSMEKHLAFRYGAQKAEIELMEHRLPNDDEVFGRGVKLDDEQLYLLLPDRPEPPPQSAEPLPPAKSKPSGQAAASGPAASSPSGTSVYGQRRNPAPDDVPAQSSSSQADTSQANTSQADTSQADTSPSSSAPAVTTPEEVKP